jgi:hypothetical protein
LDAPEIFPHFVGDADLAEDRLLQRKFNDPRLLATRRSPPDARQEIAPSDTIPATWRPG